MSRYDLVKQVPSVNKPRNAALKRTQDFICGNWELILIASYLFYLCLLIFVINRSSADEQEQLAKVAPLSVLYFLFINVLNLLSDY